MGPAAYDDRDHPRYAHVQAQQRVRLAGFGILGVLTGAVAFGALAGLFEPRRSALILGPVMIAALGTLLAGLGVFAFVLTPVRGRYHTVSDGLLTYPRWGGLRKGTFPLSPLSTFRWDESRRFLALSDGAGRRLAVWADDLSAPTEFAEALRASGAREEPRSAT